MSSINFQYVFFSAVITLLVSPLAVRLSVKIGLVDDPGSEPHKNHTGKIPLAGGLVIILVLGAIISITGLVGSGEIQAILISALVVFIFGLVDDFRSLSPGWKLLGQAAGTVVLVLMGVRVRIFPWEAMNLGLTFVWVVGITNAYNFVDSMDGLASGLAGITAGFFMLVAYESNQLDLSSFSAVLVGVCGGVYYYSAMPARYFLGDSGAQFLGFILSGLAIAYNPPGFLPTQSWFIPILLLGVPLFDTTLVIISRLRRKKPIYRSGLDHTYHRLVKLGMHPNRSVLTMHITAVLLGCLAFMVLYLPPLWANAVFALIVLSGIFALLFMELWIPKS